MPRLCTKNWLVLVETRPSWTRKFVNRIFVRLFWSSLRLRSRSVWFWLDTPSAIVFTSSKGSTSISKWCKQSNTFASSIFLTLTTNSIDKTDLDSRFGFLLDLSLLGERSLRRALVEAHLIFVINVLWEVIVLEVLPLMGQLVRRPVSSDVTPT